MNECDLERDIISMLMDLPCLVQGWCSQEHSPMFFEAIVSMSFTQRFQVKCVGNMLLDMIQDDGL